MGRKFADLHSINILEYHERQPMLWNKINTWYNQCIELYKNDSEIFPIIETIGQNISNKSENMEDTNRIFT